MGAWEVAFLACALQQRLEGAFQDAWDMVAYPPFPEAWVALHQEQDPQHPLLDPKDPVEHAQPELLPLPPYRLLYHFRVQPLQLEPLLHGPYQQEAVLPLLTRQSLHLSVVAILALFSLLSLRFPFLEESCVSLRSLR